MIRINLLPESSRQTAGPLSSLNLPWKPMGFGVVVLALVLSGWILIAQSLSSSALTRLTQEWEQLAPQRQQLQSVQQSLNFLNTRSSVMESVKGNQARWAPRLNLLTDALVAHLWFSRLQFGQMRSQDSLDPISRDSLLAEDSSKLVLEGATLVSEKGIGAPVRRFLHRLKEHPDFGRWFKGVELKVVEHRQIGGPGSASGASLGGYDGESDSGMTSGSADRSHEVNDFILVLDPTS